MNLMEEVVVQMPSAVGECVTSPLRFWTFHEKFGGFDEHVCVTEHDTVRTAPASTSAGTGLMCGLSGEAESLKYKY